MNRCEKGLIDCHRFRLRELAEEGDVFFHQSERRPRSRRWGNYIPRKKGPEGPFWEREQMNVFLLGMQGETVFLAFWEIGGTTSFGDEVKVVAASF